MRPRSLCKVRQRYHTHTQNLEVSITVNMDGKVLNKNSQRVQQCTKKIICLDQVGFIPGIGEGNGTLLQYSCLENPVDGRAWWAAVHGVAKSRTRLK